MKEGKDILLLLLLALASTVNQEKEIKRHQTRKEEVQLSLFTDGMLPM